MRRVLKVFQVHIPSTILSLYRVPLNILPADQFVRLGIDVKPVRANREKLRIVQLAAAQTRRVFKPKECWDAHDANDK